MTASFRVLRAGIASTVVLGLILAILATPLVAAAAPAAILIIDHFDTSQGPLIASLGTPVFSSVAGADIVGGERDAQISVTEQTSALTFATLVASASELRHSQDAGVRAQTLIQWDGVDGSIALNPTGLGGVDLTQANTQNGLLISVVANDLPINLEFTVYTDGSNASSYTLALPGGQPGPPPQLYYVEYAAFTATAGTGANFANVGAIELFIDGFTYSSDLTIHQIQTAAFDWGDLPDTSVGGPNYPTTFANNGPRHVIGSLLLGSVVDSFELNGIPSLSATGDDTSASPDDEDGVVRTPGVNWTAGANGGSVDVTVTGGASCLSAWIDWNGNGSLTDAGDNVLNNVAVAAGTSTHTFTVPVDPGNGSFYVRFRLYAPDAGGGCTSARTPTGQAVNGEVEDYTWAFGPNAVNLSGFTATSAGLPWAAVLVIPGGLTLAGYVFRARRRPQ